MLLKIKKRDGREVPFNIDKISNAIFKAAQAAGGQDYNISSDLASEVATILNEKFNNDTPTVEDIQDVVEKVLIENGHARTAKEYILYRAERNKIREMDSKLMKMFEGITFVEDDEKKGPKIEERAMKTMYRYGSESAKRFYDLFILNQEYSNADRTGDIRIHNLEYLALTTENIHIDMNRVLPNLSLYKENKNLNIFDYFNICSLVILENQNDQHGEQALADVDYFLAEGVKNTFAINYRENLIKTLKILFGPLEENLNNIFSLLEGNYNLIPRMGINYVYLEKESEYLKELIADDKLIARAQKNAEENAIIDTIKDTKDACKIFTYNMNSINSKPDVSKPSSSISYGMDTSLEGRLVINALLDNLKEDYRLDYPIHIFKVKDSHNGKPLSNNYDLLERTFEVLDFKPVHYVFLDSKYNDIFMANKRNSVNYNGDRFRVGENIYNLDNLGSLGRGNLSYTTINLPRLAIKSENNVGNFFKYLDQTMNLVIAQLLERFEIQASKKKYNYPFLMGKNIWIDSNSVSEDDYIKNILKNGTLSISYVGLAECLTLLTGRNHGESTESEDLGLEIIKRMKSKLMDISIQYNMNFNLMGGKCDYKHFLHLDRLNFPQVDFLNDIEEYTDSFHLPSDCKVSLMKKIEIEGKYHEHNLGGHVIYINLDEKYRTKDDIINVLEKLKINEIGYAIFYKGDII